MFRWAWLIYTVVGAFVIAAAALLGPPYSHALGASIALGAGITSLLGPRRWGTKVSLRVWIWFVGGGVGFGLSALTRSLEKGWGAGTRGDVVISDLVELFAFGCYWVAGLQLARLRGDGKEGTNAIDSLIVTSGFVALLWVARILPALRAEELTYAKRSVDVVFSVVTLCLIYVTGRITLSSKKKQFAYIPISLSVVFGLVSQVFADQRGASGDVMGLTTGLIALLFQGTAMLHPSIVRATEAIRLIPRMSKPRFYAMLAGTLVAPILMVHELLRPEMDRWALVGLTVLLVASVFLVIMRLTDLIRKNERAQIGERDRRRAVRMMAARQSEREILHVAVGAAKRIIRGDARSRVSLLRPHNGDWKVVASSGQWASGALGTVVSSRVLQQNYGVDPIYQSIITELPLDVESTQSSHIVSIRAATSASTSVAALISTPLPLSQSAVDVLAGLLSDASFVLQSVELSHMVHQKESEARFAALARNATDIIVIIDEIGVMTYMSESVQQLLGYRQVEFVGTAITKYVHKDDAQVVLSAFSQAVQNGSSTAPEEFRVVSSTGEWKTLEVTFTDFRHEPSVGGIVANGHDVTRRKALEENLRHNALHDALTGVANRVLLTERLQHALVRRSEPDNAVALFWIDLDEFTTLNDSLGQNIGDELLRVVAFRLESYVRAHDTAARVGGDVFSVLMEEAGGEREAMAAALRIVEIIREPIDVVGRQIRMTASVGVALATETATAEELIASADVALHRAKDLGKNNAQLFQATMREMMHERLEVRAELDRALDRKELFLVYQPIICMRNHHALGFEALLRWNNKRRGFIRPDVFIPIAEESDVILPIGEWVLNTAVSQLREWQHLCDFPELTMNINVSPRQFVEPDFADRVRFSLDSYRINPSTVTLEVTETLDSNDGEVLERLERLRELGIELAADDFGTGYASYASIQRNPYTNVKIDRSLIEDVAAENGRAAAQIASIVTMAHAMGATVTAEGIETHEQRVVLERLGVDKGQGYLFAKPMPIEEVRGWLVRIQQRAPIATG